MIIQNPYFRLPQQATTNRKPKTEIFTIKYKNSVYLKRKIYLCIN